MDWQQTRNVCQSMCRKLTKSDIKKLRFILTDILDEKVDNPIHEAHSAFNLFMTAFGPEHLTLQLLKSTMLLLGRNDLVKELERVQPCSSSPLTLTADELPEYMRGRRLHLFQMLERKQLNKRFITDIVFFHDLNVSLTEKEWPAVAEQLLYKYPLDITASKESVSHWVRKHIDSVNEWSPLERTPSPGQTTTPEIDEATAPAAEYACACTSDDKEDARTIPKSSRAEHSKSAVGMSPLITEGSGTMRRSEREGHENKAGQIDTLDP